MDLVPDVDDTDGLDPAAEFEDWRARELARMLRDQQAAAERDAEQAEIEKRRAMPEEQRLREDEAYAQKTRDEKPKGERAFMEKYYHKGAFHQVGQAPDGRTKLMALGRRTAQERLQRATREYGGCRVAAENHAETQLWKGTLGCQASGWRS